MRLSTASIFILAVTVLLSVEGAAADQKRTPVEIWCGGDDGLTIRLRDAMESVFKESPDFSMPTGKRQPGTLIVTIPTHVEWTRAGDSTHERYLVRYTVEFSSASGQALGRTQGNCRDDEYPKCAVHILNEAKVAVRKIRQ